MDQSILLQLDKHLLKEEIFFTAIFDRRSKLCPRLE